MVRRALLDRGDELTADTDALSESPTQGHHQPQSGDQWVPARSGQVAPHWRGAGGRWLVWTGRVVIWAVIVLVGYRGVLAIVGEPRPAARTSSPPPVTSSARFPVAVAEAYALEFGNVYLNFSPATAIERSKALAVFLPSGANPELGWNGVGTQQLLDEQVAGITVSTPHSAVVTLLGRLASGSLIELGVPVYASGDAMSVSGDPALLPGPAKADATSAIGAAADPAMEAALRDQLAAFFPAYASGDQETLARFLTPGAHITGLGGEVRFGAINAIYAPIGGTTRAISVTVTWKLPAPIIRRASGRRVLGAAPALQMTYEMTVVRRGGAWDVSSVGASAQAPP